MSNYELPAMEWTPDESGPPMASLSAAAAVTGSGELPENLLGVSATRSEWNGITVDVTEFRCAGRVVHRLPSGFAQLSVVLEEVGEPAEPRLHPGKPCPIGHLPRHMLYAPAGLELWGFSADTRYVRDISLSFDLDRLGEKLDLKLDRSVTGTPRLRFVDDRIWALLKPLSQAVGDDDPSSRLYGDGLTTAIAARLFAAPAEPRATAARLAPWQLRRVLDHLEDCLPDAVSLKELSGLVGLSQWHFSRAFKASTGKAPYQWQLDARIRRAQSLLLGTGASLDQVAQATGFADAVHFGKTFRRVIGTAPGAWRAQRKI